MINAYQTVSFMENRLYISEMSDSEIKTSIYSKSEKELVGAGIRSYHQLTGWFFSLLGMSSKVNVGDRIFYINNKSLSKLVIRLSEISPETPASQQAEQLNSLFIKYKKVGYDQNKLDLINNRFKEIIKNKEIKDWSQIILHLTRLGIPTEQ